MTLSTTQPARPWVVLSDGEHARIVVQDGSAYRTIRAFDSAMAHRTTAGLGSERPGRTGEQATGLRHAIEPRADRHRQAKAEFAGLVAETINQAVGGGECGSFVLVAPARQLTALRQGLDAEAATRLSGALTKDLIKVPDAALAPHLEMKS